MSTDWGYGCETCGLDEEGRVREAYIIDNCRGPGELARWLDEPMWSALTLMIKSESDWRHLYLDGAKWALEFAISHRERGHVVRVCDEHRQWENACHRQVKCGECGFKRTCALKRGHEGECRRTA